MPEWLTVIFKAIRDHAWAVWITCLCLIVGRGLYPENKFWEFVDALNGAPIILGIFAFVVHIGTWIGDLRKKDTERGKRREIIKENLRSLNHIEAKALHNAIKNNEKSIYFQLWSSNQNSLKDKGIIWHGSQLSYGGSRYTIDDEYWIEMKKMRSTIKQIAEDSDELE